MMLALTNKVTALGVTAIVGGVQFLIAALWAWRVGWAVWPVMLPLLAWLPCIIAATVCSSRNVATVDKSWISLLAVGSGVYIVWAYLVIATSSFNPPTRIHPAASAVVWPAPRQWRFG